MKQVILTRKVAFSSGHRYWFSQLDAEENRALFGKWASPYSHGHNYALHCSVRGPIEAETGMVVNIKTLDDVLQREIVLQFDQKSLNDEVPEFLERSACLENLLLVARDRLSGKLPGVQLVRLRIDETPDLFSELDLVSQMMTVSRSYEFAASHRLHSDALSDEDNVALFGKCNNPAGHGHNYVLEVTVSGKQDPKTGFLVDLGVLDAVVHERVIDRYDHKNLNCDVPELQGKIPTSEIVAKAMWDQLEGRVPGQLERIRLWETARNLFEVNRG